MFTQKVSSRIPNPQCIDNSFYIYISPLSLVTESVSGKRVEALGDWGSRVKSTEVLPNPIGQAAYPRLVNRYTLKS
jgi:hypothetical protein